MLKTRKISHFVIVNPDGPEVIVQFHINVRVHRIRYVLALMQVINRFVFVLRINGVLVVFSKIQSVNRHV